MTSIARLTRYGFDGNDVHECVDGEYVRRDTAMRAADDDFRALASAIKKMLPPPLLAEVIAHLDPVTPFIAFLRGEQP